MPTTSRLDNRDTGKQGSRQRSDRENQTGELHTESGLEAEKWLGNQLREIWPNVEKVHAGSDFVLQISGRTVYVEAKHVETQPGIIHWSDRQYERAKQTGDNEDSYFIAVLSPDSGNSYTIHWIWDPLEELKALERNLIWSGRSEPRPLQPDNWDVDDLKPPNVPSRNFSIAVKLTDDVFEEENQEGPSLEKLRAKLEGLK